MSMISWPFDATVTQDTQGNPIYSRAYSSDVLAKILAKYFRNGVINTTGTEFQVVQGSGMTVSLLPGHCLINGRHGYSEAAESFTLAPANASLGRYDTIVLRLDLSVNALTILPRLVTGTPSASPSATALTRNSTVYELMLAYIYVGPGATAITQANITDMRLNNDHCGVVASIIADTNTSAYYAQIASDLAAFRTGREAAFDAWFASVKNTLSGDAAGNLLNLINANTSSVTQAKNALTARLPNVCTDNPGTFNIDEPPHNGLWNCWPEVTTGTLPTPYFNLEVIMWGTTGYQSEWAYTSDGPVYYRSRNGGPWTPWEQVTRKACLYAEHFTGVLWTDGRKIYEKTVVATLANGMNSIAHGISNIGTFRAIAYEKTVLGDGNSPLPKFALSAVSYADASAYSVYVDTFTGTQLTIWKGAYEAQTALSVTLRYTCTDR